MTDPTKPLSDGEPPYTLAETIAELDGWANRGQRMCPIETAESALYWLECSDVFGPEPEDGLWFESTIERLREWLGNEEPYLPDVVGEAALYWLRHARSRP